MSIKRRIKQIEDQIFAGGPDGPMIVCYSRVIDPEQLIYTDVREYFMAIQPKQNGRADWFYPQKEEAGEDFLARLEKINPNREFFRME